MSTSSSYYSSLGDMYESIEEPQDERWTRQAARQTFNQNRMPMPAHSSAEYYMIPRPRPPSRASAQHQAYPPNTGHHIQPAVRGTVPQIPVHYQQDVISDLPSRNMPGSSRHANNQESEDHHVAQIVREMEKDVNLMEDNPLSEQLRVEALRGMPESLTLKRTVKRNLTQSVSRKSKRTPLSTWKMLKYRLSTYLRNFSVAVRNLLYTLELWYSSLKTIEGHFGSGVASYFRFLRWLFLLNIAVFLISFGFVVIPQLLHHSYQPVEENQPYNLTYSHVDGFFHLLEESNSTTYLLTPVPVTTARWKAAPSNKSMFQFRTMSYAENVDFSFGDIFTGEGSFTGTVLYHGYYSNESVSIVAGLTYHMPPAYFFTVLACYLCIFVVVSVSMARSYRRTFIETTGDMKDVFCHKVFCGWDFSIATHEAATLKSSSIYNELQELLGDLMKEDSKLSWQERCRIIALRVFLNVFVGLLQASSGLLIWFQLRQEVVVEESKAPMVVPVVIAVIMLVAPVLFSWITRMENYASPRTALFVTLTKTFVMEAVVIGIVVGFWITERGSSECWETSLGQEVYRLVIVDFLFAVVGISLIEFIRFQIYKRNWKMIGVSEFDIAGNTLNSIYNQVLFFVGFYFSPLLAFIVTLKMFLTFYIKKLGLLNSCRPSTRPWRAAQTLTFFLVLSFVASLVVLILLGYIVTQVESSTCGPFRHYSYPYGVILEVFQVQDDDGFLKFIEFITKPGVIGGILLAMCVGVYCLREQALAHKSMVQHLREMLVLDAKDKEFLLSSISRVNEGRINVSPVHHTSDYERQRYHPDVREHRF